jgi:hypothetical protein
MKSSMLRSPSLPTLIQWLNPAPSSSARLNSALAMDPLWEMNATEPRWKLSASMAIPNVARKLRCSAATPIELGPTNRNRPPASSTSSCCAFRPASPDSAKPAE